MFGVEQHDPELLDGLGAVLGQEIRGDVLRTGELHARRGTAKQGPAAQFDSRQDLRRPGHADPVHAAQIVRAESRKAVQPAACFENGVGQHQRVRPADAAPQDDGQQLVVPQARRAQPKQLLTRPIVQRKFLHTAASSAGSTTPAGPRRTWSMMTVRGVRATLISTRVAPACLAASGSAATG